MQKMAHHYDADENEDDEDEEETDSVEWMNIIFLPFHPVFRLIVLCALIIKITVNPIDTLYPIIQCDESMEANIFLLLIKYGYTYLCDAIYAIDTFLHIVHRLADNAKQREFLPKSKLFLMLDVISLIPFYRLLTADVCPPIQFWPNVLNLITFVIVYRIDHYFSLRTTHNVYKIVIGYTLLILVTSNFMACTFILITHREPHNSTVYLHDWRRFFIDKIDAVDTDRGNYINAVLFVTTYTLRQVFNETRPQNIMEYFVAPFLMMTSFVIYGFIFFPKSFGEALLKLRRIFEFIPRMRNIIAETRRRSPSVGAHVDVANFYNLMWKKRSGITTIPEIITEFPRHLRLDIKQDLTWPIFYHSPTLRRVSMPFKKWLCDLTHLDFKLPNENFFTNPHCHSHLFYLKSGIVQLISAEDGTTPLLSMTSGTIFGDINFFLPPSGSKDVIVRCLTYCEIYFFTRADILKALHMFPEDRKRIFERINNKIKHARTLYSCKRNVRGLDRVEDEGVAWIKRRWWELSEAIATWKKTATKTETKCLLPPEETVYHCSKYIGQLVLSHDEQLQRQSMFANCQFPWILMPDSAFDIIWQWIVTCTVALVLILYPPLLPVSVKPNFFPYFQSWTNTVYIADICLSLLTAIEVQGHLLSNFASVMFERCKSSTFILNLLATIWIEDYVVLIGNPEFYTISQFNRLIKCYVVFVKNYTIKDINSEPVAIVYQAALIKFSFIYITGYFIFALTKINPNLSISFFFGAICENDKTCEPTAFEMIKIALSWAFRNIYVEPRPNSIEELYIGFIFDYLNCLIVMYCAGRLIAVFYLKNRDTTDFLYFSLNIRNSFRLHCVHPEIWRRLEKYLNCYWKFNRKLEVTDASMLRHEPYDIYWKAHGEIAAKIIMDSKAFRGANPALIKELAHHTKFMILPKNSTISLTGVPAKNVSWLVNGVMIREYQTDTGLASEQVYGPSKGLISCAIFFRKPALITCTTRTECEVLCLSTVDFFRIISRYPLEKMYIRSCTEHFRDSFNDLVKVHLATQKTYKWNELGKPSEVKLLKLSTSLREIPKSNWRNPQSNFTKYWMAVRAVFVVISIVSASLQGGSGAGHRRMLVLISALCDSVTITDMVIKSCTAYYNKTGLLVHSKLKCIAHYFSRGLILDIIATAPWEELPTVSPIPMDVNTALLINSVSKYARIHMLIGYFDYLADFPVAPVAWIMLIKWQVFTILLFFTSSHYLIFKCVKFEWNYHFNLINVSRRDKCWMPKFLKFDESPSQEQMQLLFGESFNLAQSAYMGVAYGLFNISRSDLALGTILYSLTIAYWCVFCHALATLVLTHRGSTLFQHAFGSLVKFLHAERLDEKLIRRSLAHFSYWWTRTKSINIYDTFINKRVSSMFRQDLIHYFYRQTFAGLNTILQGGEQMMKHLSCVGLQYYMLPNVPIMREMDLNPWVFIVHRGEVGITQGGKTLAILKKVRYNIHQYPESELDYIQVKNPQKENPYNTVRYLLRGAKTIQMPWMEQPVKAHLNTWYSCWLGAVWVIGPFLSAAIVLLLNTLPLEIMHKLLIFLVVLDILHLAHFVSEFYTVELVVVDDKCENRHIKLRKFKEWQIYLDILSLILPVLTIFTNNWGYQLGRLLRLRFFYDFSKYFCQDYKNKLLHVLCNLAIFSLIIHAMVCGWVVIACRRSILENTYYIPKYEPPEGQYEKYYNEWIDPDIRGEGCRTLVFASTSEKTHANLSFLVPMRWQDDYAIALGFVISHFTRSNSGTYTPATYEELCYKCVICFILNLVCIWVNSIAMRTLFLRYRELFNFDYNVDNLFSYLQHNGLTSSLLDCVKEYTVLLWQRQRGNWMPELVQEAPLCLREDLFVALYSYHLQDIPLFRSQPAYFTRQLATRLHRVVIFPGRALLHAGDIFACMYFIHEGEVEKWYTDPSGEKKMVSLLTTNGFFGVIPGLFPDTAMQFTFITRTVVDVVFLRHRDWQDLLEGYPDIKRDLYIAARQLKKDLGKT